MTAAGARVALVAVALLLAWRILHVNAVVYEDANRPVLRVPAGGPARTQALQATLAANPAEVGALLELGLERERSGDAASAARAYTAALEIAPIGQSALRAAAALDAREGRMADAVGRLDRLLRYYPATRAWIFPLLVQWLPGREPRAALEALAAADTSWMGAFVVHACAGDLDPALAGALLVRRAAMGRAERPEVACVTERLRAAGRWPDAYQVWLNTLPRERLADVGFVFNGSFEFAPSGAGFDWIADERSAAHRVEYPAASGAAGQRALRVTWSGKRVVVPAVRQFLALDAGRYALTGMARLEGLQSVRGIQWTLRCAGEPRATPLGASGRFLGSGEWERFAFDVEVPARCAGQVLQLEPAGLHEGTTYVTGKAWFDDLRLARAN